ncbi:gliding motility-associated C-terminal domain-containing protein [Flavobacterium terrae]|uniref:gliding motility-associated C-terminal domain-containing protein n=1 Tax=Flavobacterium terrae TaxID=415425 RepID=UPI00093518F1|nr:gliding motility-associated C-terminal domain-containing protein [Flavobacterium terrae]
MKAQINYINASSLVTSDHVTNPTNATLYDNSFATLNSYGGVAVGIGGYSGKIELQFPTVIPAGKTTYVRIDFDQDLLNSLIGGNLGSSLADLLGTLVLGNHFFTVSAKNNTTVISTYSSQNNFSNESGRLIRDASGNFYFAITPNLPYNRIEITDNTNAVLLGTSNSMRVYYAFYTTGTDSCSPAFATSFDGTGGTLDLIGLGGAEVDHPEWAIDPDVNTYSHLSLGILAAAGTLSQTVYFNDVSLPTDQVHIKMRLDNPSILNLGLSDGLKIEALNGTNVVYTLDVGTILDLDLLGLLSNGQTVTIPITPGQSFDRIKVTLSSLVQLNIAKGLRIYDVYKSVGPPTIAIGSQNVSICGPQSVTLYAQTDSGNELLWYDSPNSTTPIATTAYNVGFTTPFLNATTTYYVAARKIGCPAISSRTAVTVTFTTLPVASDISIPSPVTASCSGVAVLSPTTLIANSEFHYYTDQNKTTEITTGFSGHAGITYVKDSSTGSLTISGLNATNTPRTYYISIEVNGMCENLVNTLLPVDVIFPSQVDLDVSATLTGCGVVNLRDAILNFDSSGNTTYVFLDSNHNVIPLDQVDNIQISGTYYIQAVVVGVPCASSEETVVVTINSVPQLTVNPNSYVINVGDSVTLQATSNATVTWYDANGVALASSTVGPFSQAGVYTFTAVASNGLCSVSAIVTIVVNNPANCTTFTERVYADTQSSASIVTGTVLNDALAVDHNPQTHSTISSGLGVLGVGTTWQTLQWNNSIAAGTPLSVKLGTEYSGLALIGAISVVATKRDGGGVPQIIGTSQPLSGTLVDLLSGENSFEYTFVPSDNTGPKIYDGVRIIVGSAAGVVQNARVYEAYYTRVANPLICNTGDVEDIFYGTYDLGVGALTSTTSVVNPWNAVDNDDDSYATMYNGVGILSASDLTVKFRTASQPTDVLKIKLTKPGTALTVSALSGFTVQCYMGNTPVGNLMVAGSSAATIQVIDNDEIIFISNTQLPTYDRVQIRLGGAANMLDFLQVNYVKREANISVVGGNETTIEICQGGTVSISGDACTSFRWYDSEFGGTILANGNSYTLPSNLPAGTYVYYVQPIRGGCEVLSRTKITVIVLGTSPSGLISNILINSDTDTTICSTSGDVLLTAQLNSTPPITNPVYYWYSFDGTNQILIPGQNSNTLQLTGLVPGTYTYFVGISSTQFCESTQPDIASITFTILPFSVANDINANDIQICLGSNAVIQPVSALSNPVFSWYFTNDYSQPIINGTFGGATYTINSAGQLTISGLSTIGSPYTYYISMSSDVSCPNLSGNLKAVSVQVNETLTPTTNDTTQDFCQLSNPTVSSLQVNEPNVVWYDAPNGGNVLAANTPLINGMIYYASLTNSSTGCTSINRLAVTANLNNAPTPTTNNTTQDFCQSSNPTVASLQVNEPNVVWYDAINGGNVLATNTPLINGMIYYGSITNPVTGCSSDVRLAVTVNLDPANTPTTNNTSQDFCQSTNPTVASLQVNEPNVVWYDAANGGNVLVSSTPLIDGMIYYAGIVNPSTGCESIIRLAVSVNLDNGQTPTTNDTTQDFCQPTPPTVSSLQVNEPNVVWYDAATGGNILSPGTLLIDGMIYYASITNPSTGCSSVVRLAVTANLDSAPTPTTNDTTQNFCQSSNPTVALLQANEPNVVWYDAATGGNALPSSTLLVDGEIYYAGIVDPVTGCTTTNRLAVTANLDAAPTPTTNDTTQDFCESSNPTIASLQVNEPNVIWYDAASGGNPLASSTPLVDGMTYYAGVTDSVTGCSTINRLMVTVSFLTTQPASINTTSNSTCAFDEITYNTETGMSNYQWTVSNNAQIISGGGANDSSITVAWTQLGTNTITVSYTNTAICNLTSSQSMDLLVEKCVLSVSGDECFTVYNEFTPNGDGSNDFFNIKCAESFPNNKLEIYNRYGNLVYQTTGYKNDWKGDANVSGTFNGNVLPTGTYYYIFDTGESSSSSKSGWLYIMR